MNGPDSRYDDLIALPRPEPQRHPRMPRADRAAQFAPFAALTGYEKTLEAAEAQHLADQPSMYEEQPPQTANLSSSPQSEP